MKVGRNEKCHCGSNKKYKRCCGSPLNVQRETLKEIHAAAAEGLEYDERARNESLIKLQEIAQRSGLSSRERFAVEISLANGYRNTGQYQKALAALDLAASEASEKDETVLYYRSICLSALGETSEAAIIFDDLRKLWQGGPEPQGEVRRARGFYLIEGGKIYSNAGNDVLARECWLTSLKYLRSFGETEHVIRVSSNLALLDLHDPDPDISIRGVAELEDLTRAKLQIGDYEGAANNYCNLGTYYWEKKRYGRAIAFYRKDLSLSRLSGNKRGVAVTLGNLSMLYADAFQLKQARSCLREAGLIAAELDDTALAKLTERQLAIVAARGKAASENGTKIGPDTPCACGSDSVFRDCCGQADFEPVELPFSSMKVSSDAHKLHRAFRKAGRDDVSRLDFLLRNTEDAKRRRAWSRVETHDGWVCVKELPDMANTHLMAAKALASSAGGEDNETNLALGATILAVCHLEAFVNQLSFFLHEEKSTNPQCPLDLPVELATQGPLVYQRQTSLETKWLQLCAVLLGDRWLEARPVWKEVRDLIYIRNELVHFKTNGYEQVIPVPSSTEPIYQKVPASVEIKNMPHAWPTRIINLSLAAWAVRVAESMVDELKQAFILSRHTSKWT